MPEIKWIKLATDIFDDDKIRLIEAMPDADTLLIIWVKLLCQAGKANASGYIFLSRDIPFSEDDLATLFKRPVNTIRLALTTFQRLEMIEVNDNGEIFLPKWDKHQNIIALENIKEQARIRQQKHRLALKAGNNVTSRDSHSDITQQNKKGERRKKKEKGDTILAHFEKFWSAYPKKKSKGYAERVFRKINPDEQLLATMLAKIERARKSDDWLKNGGQYIPYPATWLNARGWEDENQEKGVESGENRRSDKQARPSQNTVDRLRRSIAPKFR